MKKSEMLQKLINIEREKGEKTKITMDYIHYLKGMKNLVEVGDIEIE